MRRACTFYGELGDGVCVDCWDMKEGNRTAIAREKRNRKNKRNLGTEVAV